MALPIALQLYTVRDETERDFIETLEKVAAMGYKGVEFAGFGDIPAKQMKAALDRLGLKAVGSHTGIDLIKDKLDEVIEYNLEIGNKYVICPWAPFKTREDYMEAARLFNGIGAKCKARGIQLAYHNHDFELAIFDGKYGLDILYRSTLPENLAAEIDTCWVFYAGVDPVQYIAKYKGRCPLIHLKDMKSKDRDDFIELGDGIVDISAIVKAAEAAGSEWLVAEMDSCPRPALESARICIDNLKKMNLI
ncbi:MAG: sugar phosphate isomerase/epimerase [Ruminiclostridium sp.]|nr:sugar phosphate isomerase/epimerase [Ruminiclostridium sp.]